MDHLSFKDGAEYDETTVGTETAKDYYVWQPGGSPFTINLDLSVVDKLHTDIMRGFGAVRRRGTEVGGILLGRIDVTGAQVAVTIEEYVPVVCEYAHGPSYILSGEDIQRFRKALAEHDPSTGKRLYTVGFYRSHTREGLKPDEHDIKFFHEYFPDPLHVALLVQPFATRAPVAGFFIQEKGGLKSDSSYLEFPFRRRELGGGDHDTEDTPRPERDRNGMRHRTTEPAHVASQIETTPVDEPVLTPVTAPVRPPADEQLLFTSYDHKPSAWKSRLAWLALGLMLIVFGVVIGTQYTGGSGHPISVSAADPYALNLAVSRVEDNLLVTWDPKSLAVKGGWRGILTITEASGSKNVQMEPPKLQNGSVLYRHVAPEVTFRLEVFVKEHRSVVESMVYHMAPGETAPSSDATRQ